MTTFYVYLHRYASGPKLGQIFYVGKGCGKRASSRCGRTPSEASRERMRQSNKVTVDDMKARGFDRTGSKWTNETRSKLLSPALRAKIGESQRKSIICSNGLTFSHGDAAAQWLSRNGRVGVSKANISKCCHGQRKSAYGFKWAFIVSTD